MGYLRPDIDVLDINVEYGFTLSASGDTDDDDYQIPGLDGDPEEEGEEY